jgi:RNA polymerase sigma factor (sigma-70 family)
MTEDSELLHRYASDRSESAFSELIRRHVDLVYSAALRLTAGDVHRAQDVTQQVFTELARQAGRLTKHPALVGWLYTTTRRMALHANRSEQRWQAREIQANSMKEQIAPALEPEWNDLRSVLDESMHKLGETDRLAVLLRFFQNKNLQEVGAVLGLSENAARMRVDRALEKLRAQLARKGVTSTSAALAVVLTGNAISAAPAAFVASLAVASLAGAAAATGSTATLLKLMATTKLKLGVSALAITGVAISLVVQHQSQLALRKQNESLRQQLGSLQTENEILSGQVARTRRMSMPRLPAPSVRTAVASGVPAENLQSTNLFARVSEKPLQMTAEQAENFLTENNRSAASLLAAFRTTGNPVYLMEAMQIFPDDPQVAFEAALKKDTSPEEKRRWLDVLKKSGPDNPFGNYLSALEYFNSGQADQAVQELVIASGKSRFNDYGVDRLQANEEAYRSAGYPEAETRLGAAMALESPQLYGFRDLHTKMLDLANSYRQGGDAASAEAVLQMMVGMAEHFNGSKGAAGLSASTRIVALDIERNALQAMNPASPFGSDGRTAKDRLDDVARERATLVELCKQFDALSQKASAQSLINYFDRARLFGEEAALAWLKQNYGEK